jgi:lysophospholipase
MHSLFSLLLLSGIISIPFTHAATSGYAPVPAICPTTPLVRTASGLSTSESAYIASRKPLATVALGKWLQKVNSTFKTTNLPTVALTISGGGLRSLLTGAGVIQALDARDSNVGTSGLYQGLTYQAGLSGGGWLLSSFAGNNYPRISSLETNLWTQAFEDSALVPANLGVGGAYAQIAADLKAKQAAGFPPTIVDPYGRLLSYQLLYGPDGGVAIELSSITGFSNFTSHNVPFPIITALNVETQTGACLPPNNTPIYEFTPYEFGSFDSGINAFTQTKYLGTLYPSAAKNTRLTIRRLIPKQRRPRHSRRLHNQLR